MDTLSRALPAWSGDGVEQWEKVMGRLTPSTSEPNSKGKPRLNPVFVEWLMGLPAGHVTATGVSRTAQLTALGNGVVPQQAAEAVRQLIERINQ